MAYLSICVSRHELRKRCQHMADAYGVSDLWEQLMIADSYGLVVSEMADRPGTFLIYDVISKHRQENILRRDLRMAVLMANKQIMMSPIPGFVPVI